VGSKRGTPRGAEAPLSFSSPFPSQGKGDKGGWGHRYAVEKRLIIE